MRPRYAIGFDRNGLDCKKKTILIGAYLKLNGIPYRLVATSKRPDGHCTHVFPQGFIAGEWINLDATYPTYQIGQSKIVTNFQVLEP